MSRQRTKDNEITPDQLGVEAAKAYSLARQALGYTEETVLSVPGFVAVSVFLWELEGTYTVKDLGELARKAYQENAGAVPAPTLPGDALAWQAVAVVVHAYLGRDPAEYDEVEGVLQAFLEANGGVLGVPV